MQAIEVEVGMCVQWFPQGTISNPPRGGMVIEVGACGMATISIPSGNGGCDVKAMIRHIPSHSDGRWCMGLHCP